MDIYEAQKRVGEKFGSAFGNTPLTERLQDILGEAIELSRQTSVLNLREEAGDLISSLLQLCNESGWSAEELIDENLLKIERRMEQYKSLGRKKKVALFGGAFDPPTLGHIQVAQFVLNTSREFDEVWFMPCNSHMDNKDMSSTEHRLKMCERAVACDPRIKVFDYEIRNGLAGETYNLVKRLSADKSFEGVNFSLIIGQDNANSFDRWVNYEHLERMIRFVVVPRKGVEVDPDVRWYLNPPHIYLVGEQDSMPIESSSTEVRYALSMWPNGTESVRVVKNCVDDSVFDYILRKKLYKEKG